MKILSIETSCDETAVSVLDIKGEPESPSISILGNALFSQAKIHEKFGGVYPNLAKREHAKNLPPLLFQALGQAKLLRKTKDVQISRSQKNKMEKILKREFDAAESLFALFSHIQRPEIDVIAVTIGPGLEPALWVGITIAQALGVLWDIPVIPINHMEGHIMSVLYAKETTESRRSLALPAIALLISGGHTELVYTRKLLSYKILGETRDDAAGEAYDKVARLLGLPYPGGPEISRLAEVARNKRGKKRFAPKWKLPRPMIGSPDFDFSFSGLKTAVRYAIADKKLSSAQKEELAKEFEDAVTEVLIAKTKSAIEEYEPRTVIIAGGVAANKHIRKEFEKLMKDFTNVRLYVPERDLSTDNSVMIGIAAFERLTRFPKSVKQKKVLRADGNLRLSR